MFFFHGPDRTTSSAKLGTARINIYHQHFPVSLAWKGEEIKANESKLCCVKWVKSLRESAGVCWSLRESELILPEPVEPTGDHVISLSRKTDHTFPIEPSSIRQTAPRTRHRTMVPTCQENANGTDCGDSVASKAVGSRYGSSLLGSFETFWDLPSVVCSVLFGFVFIVLPLPFWPSQTKHCLCRCICQINPKAPNRKAMKIYENAVKRFLHQKYVTFCNRSSRSSSTWVTQHVQRIIVTRSRVELTGLPCIQFLLQEFSKNITSIQKFRSSWLPFQDLDMSAESTRSWMALAFLSPRQLKPVLKCCSSTASQFQVADRTLQAFWSPSHPVNEWHAAHAGHAVPRQQNAKMLAQPPFEQVQNGLYEARLVQPQLSSSMALWGAPGLSLKTNTKIIKIHKATKEQNKANMPISSNLWLHLFHHVP